MKFIPVLLVLCLLITGCLPDIAYFDSSIGSANVSSSNGTATYIPYWRTSTQLGNTRLYWDNTNSRVGVNNVAPANELDITGQVHATGNINTDSNVYASGNLTLSGAYIKSNTVSSRDVTVVTGANYTMVYDTPPWDDLRTPVTAVKLSSTKPPSVVKYKGTEVYQFSDQAIKGNEEEVYFLLQIPHSYKVGSTIEPHIHFTFTTNVTQVIKWGLDYTWTNIDALIPASVTTVNATATGANDADYHRMASFGDIAGTGKTISSMLLCRLFRNSSDAADTYTGSANLLEVDVHYQQDTIGSRQQLVK